MSDDTLSVEELLANQDNPVLKVTMKRVNGDDSRVKVTPFVAGSSGCMCSFSLLVLKSAIGSLTKTGDVHICCDGQSLPVVLVDFTDETLNDVFAQLNSNAVSQAATPDSSRSSADTFSAFMASLAGQVQQRNSPMTPPATQGMQDFLAMATAAGQGQAPASALVPGLSSTPPLQTARIGFKDLFCRFIEAGCINNCSVFGLDRCMCDCRNAYLTCMGKPAEHCAG